MSTKCSLCGRFMSKQDIENAVVWSYYDDNICSEWAHYDCWEDRASEKFKELVRKYAHTLKQEKDNV